MLKTGSPSLMIGDWASSWHYNSFIAAGPGVTYVYYWDNGLRGATVHSQHYKKENIVVLHQMLALFGPILSHSDPKGVPIYQSDAHGRWLLLYSTWWKETIIFGQNWTNIKKTKRQINTIFWPFWGLFNAIVTPKQVQNSYTKMIVGMWMSTYVIFHLVKQTIVF